MKEKAIKPELQKMIASHKELNWHRSQGMNYESCKIFRTDVTGREISGIKRTSLLGQQLLKSLMVIVFFCRVFILKKTFFCNITIFKGHDNKHDDW